VSTPREPPANETRKSSFVLGSIRGLYHRLRLTHRYSIRGAATRRPQHIAWLKPKGHPYGTLSRASDAAGPPIDSTKNEERAHTPATRPRAPPSSRASLTKAPHCSLSVPMQVETLGIARSLGWKVHMRCAHCPRDGTKRVRECLYRKQLDVDTLVCTRGPNFPLSRLESRLMCPACGSRRVTVVFEPPSNSQVCSSG
jgi:hypothetical protein